MADYFDKYLLDHAQWNQTRSSCRLSILKLPIELLNNSLGIDTDSATVNITGAAGLGEATYDTDSVNHDSSKGRTCRACGLTFTEIVEQQLHFKSPLHLLNLKRNLKGLSPFPSMPHTTDDGEDDSYDVSAAPIASDTDKDGDNDSDIDIDSDEEKDNLVEVYDSDANDSSTSNCEYNEGTTAHIYTKYDGARVMFTPKTEKMKWNYSISSAIHAHDSSQSTIAANPYRRFASAVSEIQHSSNIWCVIILRSGKFAGAIFDGNKLVKHVNPKGFSKIEPVVLAHKVIRRYTIRAKSGGGQSSHDNQGSKAKSAGAMLRRYGEQSLKDDVRILLREWSAYLQSCTRILISVPKTMRSVIFEGVKDSPLQKEDDRIVSVPFTIDKPTFEETKNIFTKCTTIIFYDKIHANEAMAAENSLVNDVNELEVSRKVVAIPAAVTVPIKPPSLADVFTLTQSTLSSQIIAACKSGDVTALESLLGSVDDTTPAGDGGEDIYCVLNLPDSLDLMLTPLHIASECGYDDIVTLLLDKGANPCSVDVRGRVPYFLATDKSVRDAFRRYRGKSIDNENRWNWTTAGVPAGLTDEMAKQAKEKEKEKKRRAQQRKKEAKEKEERDRLLAQIQIEKEAEELIKRKELSKINAGVCEICHVTLYGIKAMNVADKFCCSSPCVVKLRRRLAADAADRRMASK